MKIFKHSLRCALITALRYIKRIKIKNLITSYDIKILELNKEAESLAQEYIEKGAIPSGEHEDAVHIAIASVNRIDALASWNFKHIVSINPIRKIHEINIRMNYIIMEIGSLDLFGGFKYGNL